MLYNGDAAWTAATNVAGLIPKVPGLVSQFLPSMEYLLIAENQYTEAGLAKMENLAAAMMRLQRPSEPAAVFDTIDLLNQWLSANPELKRIFAIWIRAVLLRQSKYALALPKVHDLKELKMTLATRFDEWALEFEKKGLERGMKKGLEKGLEQGLENGMKKGITTGEARLLQRLLVARFGPLSQQTLSALEGASSAQLEAWTDRFLNARSLAEVFEAPTAS